MKNNFKKFHTHNYLKGISFFIYNNFSIGESKRRNLFLSFRLLFFKFNVNQILALSYIIISAQNIVIISLANFHGAWPFYPQISICFILALSYLFTFQIPLNLNNLRQSRIWSILIRNFDAAGGDNPTFRSRKICGVTAPIPVFYAAFGEILVCGHVFLLSVGMILSSITFRRVAPVIG